MDFQLANKNNLEQVYELVQETIQVVYPKYYLPEIVEMFSDSPSRIMANFRIFLDVNFSPDANISVFRTN